MGCYFILFLMIEVVLVSSFVWMRLRLCNLMMVKICFYFFCFYPDLFSLSDGYGTFRQIYINISFDFET